MEKGWGMGRGWRFLFLGTILSLSTAHAAQTRLVLAGGGMREANKSAVDRIVTWMSERPGHLLRIRWASQTSASEVPPEGSAPFPPNLKIKEAPNRFYMDRDREAFLRDLNEASAVYFGGGDQEFIMDTVLQYGLGQALTDRFKDGVVFAGTSAGTAIMSKLMFTGRGSETEISPIAPELKPGLGFLDAGLIIDQHFIAKKRMNRLLSAVSSPSIVTGVGVDEDGAVTITDGRYLTVLKNEKVVVIHKTRRKGRFTLDILEAGEEYDLSSGRRR